MVSIPTSTNSTKSATDTYAQLHEYSGRLRALNAVRKAQYKRGDYITAVICLGCAIATVEPATNQWLKSTPVGQFFGSIKVEQVIPKALKPEAKPQAQLINPLPGAVVTSPYLPCVTPDKSDCRLVHPVGRPTNGVHNGLDISAGLGSNILASGSGKVVDAESQCVVGQLNCADGWGNFVRISHGKNDKGQEIETLYAHLDRVFVSKGAEVKQGQVIGTEGTTGSSSGPHLHLTVYVNGKHQNPYNFITGLPKR